MQLTVENLDFEARVWRSVTGFGQPITDSTVKYLQTEGIPFVSVAACMGWVWTQWLLATPPNEIRKCIEPFVDRHLKMLKLARKFRHRPRHDLYLLHCAVFGSSRDQLEEVAERVVDTSGWKAFKPVEAFGDLYASAWCGMLKHWIFGNDAKARQESEIIWGAYRFPAFSAAPKPLVTPWLEADWKYFVRQQGMDFQKLWNRIRKTRAIKRETETEMIIDIKPLASIEDFWCWSHCGLALLAHRKGVAVATDPFLFPEAALRATK
jgi:hypothetical protein